MIYKAPLSKIKKLANPFEQVAFKDTQFPLETEQIKAAIDSNNIFEDENESPLQNYTRKIAYMVSNYDEQIITINLESNSSGWIVEQGSEYLAATIYKGVKYILADIKGSEKSILSLFGEMEIVQDVPSDKKDELINWNNIPPVSAWSNIKYIEPLIVKGLEQGNLRQVLASIEPSVWEDPLQLKNIVISLRGVVKFLPQHVLESEGLVEAVKDDYVAFGTLWTLYYKDNYNTDNLISKAIKEKVFSNADMCVNLLSYSYKVGFLYNFFSDEVKNDPNVIEKLYKEPTDQKLIDLLTPKSFEKEENVLKFLRKVPYCHLESKEYIYKDWINNKEKLITFLHDKDIACMGSFYEHIPQTIKEDKDFILACIPKYQGVIKDLSHKQLKDMDIIKCIISNKATKEIPDDIIYSLKDKEIIERAIKDNYKILLNINTPKKWLLNDDFIASIPSEHLHQLPEKIVNKYLFSEENCLHAIDNHPEIYKILSDNARANPVIALQLLDKVDNIKELLPLLDLIPKSLWSNKEFCLMGMTNMNAINFVPAPFFKHKDFLVNFFERIDENKISNKIISFIPLEIQGVLEENKIDSNYSDFLNSYLLQQKLNTNLDDKPARRKTKL
jgi:hypothetical protein